jgi:hypothetical protein
MGPSRLADHAMGLELQLEELTERQRRAVVQGRHDDAARLGAEIAGLHAELAATAERLASETATPHAAADVQEPGGPEPAPEPAVPTLHDAERLASG